MAANGQPNGAFREDVDQIKNDVRELKEELTSSLDQLQRSIKELAISVNLMTNRMDNIVNLTLQAIPLPFVRSLFLWTFGVVVLVIAGVEGAQWLFRSYLLHQ